MQALLKGIIDGIREDFGQPVKLIRFLQEPENLQVSLDDPAPCISAGSVVRWHELGKTHHYHNSRFLSGFEHGALMGWKREDRHGYRSFILHRPEYAQIGQQQTLEDWPCDIGDVHGFAASKSALCEFTSTDQMVETNSREMIDAITPEKLAANLAHDEIRIIHSPGCDFFQHHQWDGRLFLINSGGSHHFAAAKYIAARLGEPVPLRGKLYSYSLNALAITSLRRDFEMFVLPDTPQVSQDFHEAMESFRATWLWHHMPRPFADTKAILLPRSERRSMKVAALLHQAGVTDLGEHLTQLAERQTALIP